MNSIFLTSVCAAATGVKCREKYNKFSYIFTTCGVESFDLLHLGFTVLILVFVLK